MFFTNEQGWESPEAHDTILSWHWSHDTMLLRLKKIFCDNIYCNLLTSFNCRLCPQRKTLSTSVLCLFISLFWPTFYRSCWLLPLLTSQEKKNLYIKYCHGKYHDTMYRFFSPTLTNQIIFTLLVKNLIYKHTLIHQLFTKLCNI